MTSAAMPFDYAQHNIRINTLIPGTTNTELVRRAAGAMNVPDAVRATMARDYGTTHIPGMRRMVPRRRTAAEHERTARPCADCCGCPPRGWPVAGDLAARSDSAWSCRGAAGRPRTPVPRMRRPPRTESVDAQTS